MSWRKFYNRSAAENRQGFDANRLDLLDRLGCSDLHKIDLKFEIFLAKNRIYVISR